MGLSSNVGSPAKPSEAVSLGKGGTAERVNPAVYGRMNDSKLVTTRVKGHASNPYNNRCDELAVAESKKFK